eukprot:UN08304
MEDMSRGVIWEETLLTLPLNTQMVFLSATIANGDEFAKWISRVTYRPCHWIGTKFRVVPIAHMIMPKPVTNGNNNNFRTNTIISPGISFPPTQYTCHLDFPSVDNTQQQLPDPPSPPANVVLGHIVSTVISALQNRWLPLIAFSFRRKDCDFFAQQLFSFGFCVVTPKQREEIIAFCEKNLTL